MSEEKFKNILRLLRLVGGKFILVEDGQPQAVLMSYAEFSELAAPAAAGKLEERFASLAAAEEVNREITRAQLDDLREEVVVDLPTEVLQEADETEIRIEPLDPV